MKSRVTIALLGLGLCLIQHEALAQGDACNTSLPQTLASALTTRFGEYRLPREADNLPEDVRAARAAGGSACLGISSGDFDGNGRRAWVVALRSKHDASSSLIVVATDEQGAWQFAELLRWPALASHLYVTRQPPGRYTRSEGAQLGPGEPTALSCPHDVVAVGETEASQVNYCHMDGQWRSISVAE